MFEVTKVEKQIAGKTIVIETGRVANQADGSVVVTCGETMVLVSACTAPPRFDDIDWFPLSVDYRERQAAAGKFPGGFMKREGRPTTREILTARCIDRPIRPLFPDGYFQEVQIMANVMSADEENDPDVLSIIGASAALSISKIPFKGPLGAVRLVRVDGEFVAFPTDAQLDKADFNLLLGGRKDAINMIEVASQEVPENVVAEGIAYAHKIIGEICDLISELQDLVGVEKECPLSEIDADLLKEVRAQVYDQLYEAKQIVDKTERKVATKAIYDAAVEKFCPEDALDSNVTPGLLKRAIDKIEENAIRSLILSGKRTDGRANDELREIKCEVGYLPRTHGSAIFSRGETQAIVSVILGTGKDEQTIDGIKEEFGQDFMLHYNFPPYSVGEVRPVRGPGRREIGHGMLAEKALVGAKPNKEDFAYTIKVISDITGSNGSSSMASTCGGTLALLDAGVPMKRPVAGISIGKVEEGSERVLLVDILGEEDHFGDMDFKVTGTTEGVTAIQLDIKTDGLAHDTLVESLEMARKARLQILDIMNATISEPRKDLSKYAPRMTSIKINPEFIGKIIGPGGSNIKALQEETKSVIEISDNGTVGISCVGHDGYLRARDIIKAMTTTPEVGTVYKDCKVVSVKDFGVFVELVPGVEGLCHISEISDTYVKDVEDVCKVGDRIDVKLVAIDDLGRLKLSRKVILTGEEYVPDQKPQRPRRDNNNRGGNRDRR